MAAEEARSLEFTITLLGDLMLGRLIDQLLPTQVDEPEEAEIVSRFRQNHMHLKDYTHVSPWGNVLSLFQRSNLVLGNLETSVTTHGIKWPDKVFNYRMHPDNVKCLVEAGIDYVSLANNHTLDFSLAGLLETVRVLKDANISFAGAGNTEDEADAPAELILTLQRDDQDASMEQYKLHIYSFSDHPTDWAGVEQFNHLDYSLTFKRRLSTLLNATLGKPALKIVSVHWGPNYRWQPDEQIRNMAHHFIDECAVDVVWGHSSHHIQGVEVYKEKLIIYGCGDFVDDYAVNQRYRNDLSAAWNLRLEADASSVDGTRLKVRSLEVWPNRIKQFQAGLLAKDDVDHKWITERFRGLCDELGTRVQDALGPEGQIVVDMTEQ